MQGRAALRVADPEERVAAVMAEHGRALLRTANHWSMCHDDALDAYQRALEIFLRRADRVLPETEVAWLKVVIKHEALAIRRARSESVSGEEVDLDARPEPAQRDVDEQVAGGERVSRSAEALRALKPDERRALMLKAQGYSYEEIGAHLGWTYTKVNRSITEGRRRFMKLYRAIESGEACEQYAATIAALARGTASSADVIEVRPHLRHCSACRATVRAQHIPAGMRLKLLLPGFLLAPVAGLPDGVKAPEELATRDPGIEIVPPTDAPVAATDVEIVPPPDAPVAATDVQIVPPPDAPVAVPDAPAAGTIELPDRLAVPLELPERVRGIRLGRVKDEAYAVLHRTQSTDAAAGAYIATSGGGGRIATIATLIGFCVSGAGAGALCVATGVVEAPGWILGRPDSAPAPRPTAKAKPKPAPRAPAQLAASSRATEVIPTPTPTPRPRRRPTPDAAKDPSQGTAPRSHESPPISQAPKGTTSEFGPESAAGASSSPPAQPPATGGGEFLP